MADAKKIFHLSPFGFQKRFGSMCQELNIQPTKLVQFLIELPFYMPFPANKIYSISVDKDTVCGFQFFERTSKKTTIPSQDEAIKTEIKYSIVEMIYITNKEVTEERDCLSESFDTLLHNLNLLISSYMITTKDTDVRSVSITMMPFAVPCRVIPVKRWEDEKELLFLLHLYAPYNKETISLNKMMEIVQFIIVIRDNINPFVQQEQLLLTARYHFKKGFYQEAAVYAQMSIEGFLNTLYVQLAVADGQTEEEASKLRENLPFMSMLKNSFHPKIGGFWNINAADKECGRWYKSTYLLRNRIAHGGYYPSVEETEASIEAAHDFRLYIVGLIRGKKKTYSKLVEYLTRE